MAYITVNCPKCGRPVAVDCNRTGGSFGTCATYMNCGHSVSVQYSNDSFGFRINTVK